MTTTELEKPKKKTDSKERLKKEIRFWLKRVESYEFLKGIRTLVRNEGMFRRVVDWDSLPAELRKAIEEGERDIAEGRVYTSEEVFAEIEEWLGKP